MPEEYHVPVLFLIFNRPDCTKETFEAIRRIKPAKLYIAADGARKDKYGEDQLCEETRKVATGVDWDCEVKTLFRTENLGCGKSVSGAIDWFFQQEERGIILEDDCVPNRSFFDFCGEALSFYENDLGVWHIDGSNFVEGDDKQDDVFLYSNFPLIWGWATWRSRWQHYKYNIRDLGMENTGKIIDSVFHNFLIRAFWKKRFYDFFTKNIDTWDYQWMLTIWANRGAVVRPVNNLVTNIGFGADATHTTTQNLIIKSTELKAGISFDDREPVIDGHKENKLFLNRFMRRSKIFMYLFFIYDKIK